MKKTLFVCTLALFSLSAQAQIKPPKLGGAGDKIKDKVKIDPGVGKYKIAAVEDNGITNDLHKKNVGKIVFSNKEIAKAETSDAGFVNTFNLGDDIYSRVYLEKSMTNEGNSIGYIAQFMDFKVRMTVEGTQFNAIPLTARDYNDPNPSNGYPRSIVAEDPDRRSAWTTFQIGLSPNASHVAEYPSTEMHDFFYRMYQLPAGTHTVKLELVFDIPEDEAPQGSGMIDEGRKWTTKFGQEKVLAVGEFKINITDAGKIAAGKKLCPTLDWINYKLIKVPEGFDMVNKSKREGETILKVVEIHNDWTYEKNIYGIILNRHIQGKALVQNNATKLCYVVNISFHQENISSGGSKYGPTTFTRDVSFENAGPFFVKDCVKL